MTTISQQLNHMEMATRFISDCFVVLRPHGNPQYFLSDAYSRQIMMVSANHRRKEPYQIVRRLPQAHKFTPHSNRRPLNRTEGKQYLAQGRPNMILVL